MWLFSRIFGRETRAAVRASDPIFSEYFSHRGIGAMSPENVLVNSAVAAACISRRSQGLASVPVNIHRNIGPSNAARADEHALYDLLNLQPNSYQSANDFRTFLVRSHDLNGNAIAEIERDGGGRIVALHPVEWSGVQIERLENRRLRYRISEPGRPARVLLQEEVLHVRGPSRDGIYGQSPLQIARGAVGLALAADDFARSFFENSASPDGYITYPGGISKAKDQADEIRNHWMAKHGGANRFTGPAVFTDGGKFETIKINAEEAQLLDSRKYSAEDIARIFDCPPTSVGIVDRSTYSNTEQEALALVRNCLTPLAARFESAFARCLLTESERRQFFFRHDFSDLLRGDMKTRFEAYRLGRETGVYSVNDVRRLENEAPIEGGDDYHMPANWMALNAAPPPSPRKVG